LAIIRVSKQLILRFSAAESKKGLVLRNACEIDSSRVYVSVTLPGLVPLLRYSQLQEPAERAKQPPKQAAAAPGEAQPNQHPRLSAFLLHLQVR